MSAGGILTAPGDAAGLAAALGRARKSAGSPATGMVMTLILVVDEDAAHVYAEWANPDTHMPCTADLAPQGVLIAVARDVLPAGEFSLTLRESLMCPDCPDHPDQELVSLR